MERERHGERKAPQPPEALALATAAHGVRDDDDRRMNARESDASAKASDSTKNARACLCMERSDDTFKVLSNF